MSKHGDMLRNLLTKKKGTVANKQAKAIEFKEAVVKMRLDAAVNKHTTKVEKGAVRGG